MNVSRAPGAPCGSVFGRFLVLGWVSHQKINCWLVLGVAGKSRSQEMSAFDVSEHLQFFENFGKLVKAKEKL